MLVKGKGGEWIWTKKTARFVSDPDPRSCAIQKQNAGMIYTP